MNKSTKIAVIIGVLLMIIISIISASVLKVKADESVEQGYTENRHFELFFWYSKEWAEQRIYDIEMSQGEYPVVMYYDDWINGADGRIPVYDMALYAYNSKTGYLRQINESCHRITTNGEEIRDVEDYKPFMGNMISTAKHEVPVVVGATMYYITTEERQSMSGKNNFYYDKLYSNKLEPTGSIPPWDTSNHYTFDSLVYDPNLLTPDVRSVIFSRDYGTRLNDDGSLYEWDNGYYYDIKFVLPEENITPEMHTEIWADIPVRRNSTGEIEYRKVFLSSYLTSDLWEKNIPKLEGVGDKFKGDDVYLKDTGYYYHIKENWNDTIGKYCNTETANLYGGVTLYIRNARYIGGDVSVVSGYAYFTLNPSDVGNSDTGIVRPNITETDKNLSEDKSDVGTSGTNKPNSGNLDYVGGLTDTPPSSSTGSNSGMIYIPSGEWNLVTFSEWVRNGFGLLGDNGILAFIGNLFWWFPAEFFGLIAWAILVGVIIAVIKLVF